MMGRVVLLQSDARYEPYLDVALRTWLMHNDRTKWDFYLTDLGLTTSQVRKYGQLCKIVPVDRELRFGRFLHAQARIDSMISLVGDGNLLFNLDSDTLSLGSTEPWVSAFERSSAEFSGISEFPHHLFLQFNSGKPLMNLIRKYPLLGEATFSTPSWNFGLVMMKGQKAVHLVEEAGKIMKEHTDALPWAEQSAFNAAFYGECGECLQMGRVWNFMLNVHQLKVNEDWSAEAIDNAAEKIVIVHYAGSDVKISPKGPYLPYEELWRHWAAHAPPFEDLI
jgi:lipopolysaccharide biosynthesis glycosyltransferase